MQAPRRPFDAALCAAFANSVAAAALALIPASLPQAQSRVDGIIDCAPPDIEQATLAAVNRRRVAGANCGGRVWPPVPALAWSNRVTQAAALHAVDSARRDRMDHSGSDGSHAGDRLDRIGVDWQVWTENLGRGHRDISSLVEHWSRSAGHCANLMHPRVSQLGLACRRLPGHDRFWVLTLAAPMP